MCVCVCVCVCVWIHNGFLGLNIGSKKYTNGMLTVANFETWTAYMECPLHNSKDKWCDYRQFLVPFELYILKKKILKQGKMKTWRPKGDIWGNFEPTLPSAGKVVSCTGLVYSRTKNPRVRFLCKSREGCWEITHSTDLQTWTHVRVSRAAPTENRLEQFTTGARYLLSWRSPTLGADHGM